MPRFPKRFQTDVRSEHGAVLIMAAGMMVVLMLFVGLALDVGGFYAHKRALQTAADAGAYQGGYELNRGNTSLVTSAALAGTAENGYQQGTDGVTVEVYNPPVTGYYVGDPAAVEVVVRRPSTISFLTLLGQAAPTIPARAVAWAGADSRNCIHVLEDVEQDAFDYQSSAVLFAPQCGLMVDSCDDYSGRLTSYADVDVADASFCGENPGYIEESSSDLTTTSGYGPYTDVPAYGDPLAWLSAYEPSTAGCGGGTDMEWDQPTVDIPPGVYCGKGPFRTHG